MRVHAVVYRQHDHFVARCLNVHVMSFGHSVDHALVNLRECLELFLKEEPTEVVLQIDGLTLRHISVEQLAS